MGTPEFPDLGKHCSVEDCKLIDFLPFTCDRCRQVFCLEHRSYIKHNCPKADKNDVTVVICPLCANGVRLVPDEDPNITWDRHVNSECDPSNYEKVTKKKMCRVPGCREILTFSNTIKCRDCLVDHCLKHRFGTDHKCPGLKKQEASFPFIGFMSRSIKEDSKPNRRPKSSSLPKWASSFLNAASTGIGKISGEISQAWQIARDGVGSSSSNFGGNKQEECPQCHARFSSLTALVEHVEKVHEKSRKVVDVCPKCSRGFRDPVALVEHVERDHGGTSKGTSKA